MTLLSTLGYCPSKRKDITFPRKIDPNEISIVIPVKNNPQGINNFLNILFEVTSTDNYPKDIIIIDNNSLDKVCIKRKYPVPVKVKECKRKGPAAARNDGVSLASGEWILFTDSDCIPTDSTISGYITNENSNIAYAGNISIASDDMLSNYYKTQETLIPPEAIIENRKRRPDYLVTANCLVLKKAIMEIEGFDEMFELAGGEDIDLAFRILAIGEIEYCNNSVTNHCFDDGITGFIKRFRRYGIGNRILADKYTLNLRPKIFLPQKLSPSNIILALLQFLAMSYGYMKGKN